MGVVMITCPNTGRAFATGIEIDARRPHPNEMPCLRKRACVVEAGSLDRY